MMKWLIAAVLIAGAGYQYYRSHRPIQAELPPPVQLRPVTEARPPIQDDLPGGPVFRVNGYTLTALAEFSVGARVILAREYTSGRESELSPLDLALAWGPMADAAVLRALSFSQSNRFYFWRYEGEPPIPRRDIEIHSANMHMIPSSRDMERRLKAAKPGDTVRIRGYLVQAEGKDGWRWRSSLSRDDTGDGACELIFIQEFDVL